MRIKCPYCGERDAREFHYRGAEGFSRPDTSGDRPPDRLFDYVYLRDNPAGEMAEHWIHAAGCRSWLVVTRDTRTHEITSVTLAGAGAQDGLTRRDEA